MVIKFSIPVEMETDNISSFSEAIKTDIIMDKIREDASRPLAVENIEAVYTPVLAEESRQPSIWRKFKKAIGSK